MILEYLFLPKLTKNMFSVINLYYSKFKDSMNQTFGIFIEFSLSLLHKSFSKAFLNGHWPQAWQPCKMIPPGGRNCFVTQTNVADECSA